LLGKFVEVFIYNDIEVLDEIRLGLGLGLGLGLSEGILIL
jgi:hypothetical protein